MAGRSHQCQRSWYIAPHQTHNLDFLTIYEVEAIQNIGFRGRGLSAVDRDGCNSFPWSPPRPPPSMGPGVGGPRMPAGGPPGAGGPRMPAGGPPRAGGFNRPSVPGGGFRGGGAFPRPPASSRAPNISRPGPSRMGGLAPNGKLAGGGPKPSPFRAPNISRPGSSRTGGLAPTASSRAAEIDNRNSHRQFNPFLKEADRFYRQLLKVSSPD